MLARSRSYIPARLADNPDLRRTGYAAVLAGLPEELRRAYRDGNFAAGLKDHDFQVIPTAWIEAAQLRWRAGPGRGIAMTAIGLDIAQGGNDYTVLAARHGGWYAPLVCKSGHDTRDGSAVRIEVKVTLTAPKKADRQRTYNDEHARPDKSRCNWKADFAPLAEGS